MLLDGLLNVQDGAQGVQHGELVTACLLQLLLSAYAAERDLRALHFLMRHSPCHISVALIHFQTQQRTSRLKQWPSVLQF